jgi:hypothetical protein
MSERQFDSNFTEVYGNLKAIHGETYASEIAHTVNCLMIGERLMQIAFILNSPMAADLSDEVETALQKLADALVSSVAVHNRVFCEERKLDLSTFLKDKDGFYEIVQSRKEPPCDPIG